MDFKMENFMNTKRIGNIGEAKVLSKFVELGYPVYQPFGDNEKSDLIVEISGKLCRVQIKTSVKAFNGSMTFRVESSCAHRGGGRCGYTKEDIDYFALYNLERDCILFFAVEELGSSKVVVRYEPTKNNQKQNIINESEFLISNRLPSLLC